MTHAAPLELGNVLGNTWKRAIMKQPLMQHVYMDKLKKILRKTTL